MTLIVDRRNGKDLQIGGNTASAAFIEPAPDDGSQPTFSNPVCQIANMAQFLEPEFKHWACKEMDWQFGFNRKLWEYAFILQAISKHGNLAGQGLGFGVGREWIMPVMVRHGAKLVATDLEIDEGQRELWKYANIDRAQAETVVFRRADMNTIPKDLRDFDFVWSCGSLEHIGGLEAGMRFIEASLDCLKPGGLAVHTTEFNLSSNKETLDRADICFYRQRDIEELIQRVAAKGARMELNLRRGNDVLDNHVDYPPYTYELTLRAWHDPYIVTSIGLVIHKI